jgi:hypothetical protein
MMRGRWPNEPTEPQPMSPPEVPPAPAEFPPPCPEVAPPVEPVPEISVPREIPEPAGRSLGDR